MRDEATLQNPKDNIHRPIHCGHERVVGDRDRETNKVAAEVKDRTDARILTDSVQAWTEPATVVRTDEAPSEHRLNRPHQSIKHSIGKYVRGMAHTNGMESFWAMLRRADLGVFRHFSYKHPHRYVAEAASGPKVRALDTAAQMHVIVRDAFANGLPCAGVIRPKHHASQR